MELNLEEMTFEGISKYYKREFEKLGWMVLALTENRREKIAEYAQSIQRLMKNIREKIAVTQCPDKQRDLAIMYNKLGVLSNFVNKKLK